MQSHVVILIADCIGIKKDHQTLLNFAILAGKRQKRTFSYKVGCKKFSCSGQRWGHRTVALPLNTPLTSPIVTVLRHASIWGRARTGKSVEKPRFLGF